MTTLAHGRMRRHTRPADFVSKSRKAEAMAFSRPGGRSFSFNGDFPEMADQQPVEASSRRRNYTTGHTTGSYQAVHQSDTARMPAINKYGVQIVPALVMLLILAVNLPARFAGIFQAVVNTALGHRGGHASHQQQHQQGAKDLLHQGTFFLH